MATEEKTRVSGETQRATTSPILPSSKQDLEKAAAAPSKPALHPAVYVVTWISLSSAVILYNKWILDTLEFRYPVLLTTWHLGFATVMTQILARTTTLLDGRKTVKMNGRMFLRAILPIGLCFSLSLICGNLTYLYLSVAFIQMLKATTPVAVLLTSWVMGVAQPNLKAFFNVSLIVLGVVLASYGEVKFVLIGFLYQCGGIFFEAIRLVMVQRLLNSPESKMDPLVSLYYFAPVCTIMNGLVALFWEVPKISAAEIYAVGAPVFISNAMIAFLLNVSVVFLIGKTSSLVLTLCGVLKDIMLVAASMLIWGTQVTALQFFGYGIALSGLVYYKLGGDQLKGYVESAGRKWTEYGITHPIRRRLIVIGSIFLVAFITLGGLGSSYGYGYKPEFDWANVPWVGKYTTNGS